MVSLFSALIATVVLSAPLHAVSILPFQHGALKRRINVPAGYSKALSHHQVAQKKKRSAGKQRRCAVQAAASSLVSSAITTTSSVSVATPQAQVNNPGSQSNPVVNPVAQQAGPALVIAQPTTTPKPSPTPSPEAAQPVETPVAAASSSDGSGGLSAEQQQTFLTLHNNLRAQHGAAPLTWSDTLAGAGLSWAQKCVFQHSGGSLGPYGENLAAGTGDSYDVTNGFDDWAAEESQYNAGNPQPSHYTQVVWKGTQQVGCGMIPDCAAILGGAKYFVCEYFPAGNVIGEFGANVQ